MASDNIIDSAGSPATVGRLAGVFNTPQHPGHYVVSISGCIALANPRTGVLSGFPATPLYTSADGTGAVYFDAKEADRLVAAGGTFYAASGAISTETIRSRREDGAVVKHGEGASGESMQVVSGVLSAGIATQFVAPLRVA